MDCVATISDGAVYSADTDAANSGSWALSHGWSQRDGAFGAFWLQSPSGAQWKVKTKRLSTAVLVLTDVSSGRAFLLPSQGRGIRSVFAMRQPGVEVARIVCCASEAGVHGSDFEVYSDSAVVPDGTSDWLIAAALAVAAVDGHRSIRR